MSDFPQPPYDPYVNAQVIEKPGMSSGAKVLLTLAIVVLVVLLLCCGGGAALIYMGFQHMKEVVSEDPAVVAQRRTEMLDIEIPESFKPQSSIDGTLPFVGARFMTFVVYQGESSDNTIVLIGLGEMLTGGSRQDIERQFKESLRQQDFGQPEPGMEWETKTKEFTIGGEPTTFIYRMAKSVEDAPKPEDAVQEEDASQEEEAARQEDTMQEEVGEPSRFYVTGMVTGKRGPVFVVITANAETLSEEQIDQIIESIE